MLAILDYKAGNQTSVRRALEHLGIPCAITADPATLERAHGIIFPGVGAAGQAMRALHPTGLDVLLRECVKRGQPRIKRRNGGDCSFSFCYAFWGQFRGCALRGSSSGR